MALTSGEYAVKTTKTVVVWPGADMNGDGPEKWEPEYDDSGMQVDMVRVKDKHGNEVFDYLPPEGFVNKPGYDHTDNYVKVSERGQVVRTPAGEAIGIKPGQALVFNPDGSIEVLTGDRAQYVFGLAHNTVKSEVSA